MMTLSLTLSDKVSPQLMRLFIFLEHEFGRGAKCFVTMIKANLCCSIPTVWVLILVREKRKKKEKKNQLKIKL